MQVIQSMMLCNDMLKNENKMTQVAGSTRFISTLNSKGETHMLMKIAHKDAKVHENGYEKKAKVAVSMC